MRLTRVGGKKDPIWRVVVADQRSPRDGRVIETIGHYNAQTDPSTIVLDEERVRALARRAAPSRPTRCASCCSTQGIDAGRPRRPLRMRELLEYLARALVDEPDARARSRSSRRTTARVVLELSVGDDDYGKVIGRGGRTAQRAAHRGQGGRGQGQPPRARRHRRREPPERVARSRAGRPAARARRLLPRDARRAPRCCARARRCCVGGRPRARSCAAPGTDERPILRLDGLRRAARRPRRCAASELLVAARRGAGAGGGRVLGRGPRRAARSSTASARVGVVRRMLALPVVRGARGRARRRRRAARAAGARRDPLGRRRRAGAIDVDLGVPGEVSG